MNSNAHVGDGAELYAAGALTAQERDVVDAHIAACNECLRRVGEAEETVLALERVNSVSPNAVTVNVLAFKRRAMPAWFVATIAAAAAFVLGLIFPHGAPQPQFATLAMLHGHFSHAQFTGNGPLAKVIYARDRSWYYIIVEGNHRYGVYGIANGASVKLGTTQANNGTSQLFLRGEPRLRFIELRDVNQPIEKAAIR